MHTIIPTPEEGGSKLVTQIRASLKLSGTIVNVGVDDDGDEPTIWYQTDDQAEPIYMSPCEGRLLIEALKVAVCQATGKDD